MTRRISPLARLDCENSIKLAKAINSPVIVIPIYDFISSPTGNLNKKFEEVKKCGGLHSFLNYDGIIILSLIMKDSLIKKFESPRQYAKVINCLNPNFYFTPDGLTYEKKEKESLQEIIRLSILTPKLIRLCPNSKPIGLVKGSNRFQIINHRNFLKDLGIKIFAFHTGEFFRQGNKNMINKAKYYCSLIKDKENFLILYGLGSPRWMLEFSFSDMFITYSHFVNAKHKRIFFGTKRRKTSKKSVYEIAFHNFKEFSKHLNGLKNQTKLLIGGKCKWEEGMQELQLITQGQKVKV